MATDIVRMPLADFVRDVVAVLQRVSSTGEPVEVVWDEGSVVLAQPACASDVNVVHSTAPANRATDKPAEDDARARILRHYQSVPALPVVRSDRELTELAWDEYVRETVRRER